MNMGHLHNHSARSRQQGDGAEPSTGGSSFYETLVPHDRRCASSVVGIFLTTPAIWKVAGGSPDVTTVLVGIQIVQPLYLSFCLLERGHHLLNRDGKVWRCNI